MPRLTTAGTVQLDPIASDPGTPINGEVWVNSTDGLMKWRAGGETVPVGANEYSEDNTTSSTTFAAEQVKLSHVSTATSGNYIVFYQAEISNDSNGGQVRALFYEGGTARGNVFMRTGNPAEVGEYSTFSGFRKVTLSGATTFQIRYLRPGGGGNAQIRRARILLMKVA